MRGAWKRFVQMPDAERAMLLAKIAAVVVIIALYSLGAASLYLRQRYLGQPAGLPAGQPTVRPTQAITPTAPPTRVPQEAPATKHSPTPTLYPTITPSAGG